MKLLARAWLAAERLRRRGERDGVSREELIRREAPGRSFADIGCMWNVDGRFSFLAEEAGAASVTGFDAMEPTPAFRAEHERRSSRVRFVRGDLHDERSVEQIGVHDVVLCTGVLYHSPSPFLLLERLRALTGELLILGTHTIPEVPGLEQACVFYPGMSAAGRAPFGRAVAGALGLSSEFDPTPEMAYANYWWGVTRSAQKAMLATAGFELVEAREVRPLFTDFVCRRI